MELAADQARLGKQKGIWDGKMRAVQVCKIAFSTSGTQLSDTCGVAQTESALRVGTL